VVTVLLDTSVIIAAAFQGHVHHHAADEWLADLDDTFATCPITQGAVLRAALRSNYSTSDAQDLLSQITASDRHEFWADDLGFADVRLTGVIGHRQVTDAYLAALARQNRGNVATLDKGFAALHADVAHLVPTA
jgi:hypothetical protein